MNLAAVLHIPMSEYCYGLDETHIVYRLRCAKGDLKQVTLNYGDTACRVTPIIFTPVKMEIVSSDALHDYWQIVVASPYNRVYYYFLLDDGEHKILYYGDVFTDHLVDDRSQYFKLPFNHRADIVAPPNWVKDTIVYNVFPDSFATGHKFISQSPTEQDYNGQNIHGKLGGTLRGVAENVDYLLDLGVNCVYLNPIFVAGEYHKYDLLDYFHVDPCFGGDEAFQYMVETLHANSIRVIIDGVFNHCGWYFFAFDDVVKHQQASPYCDWFYHLEFPVSRPQTPEEYPTYACYAYERMMPKLDTSNPKVCDYFCKVGRYWVENFHIDGWRLDVASEVNDNFWRAFRSAVKQANPQTILIGEVWESAAHWLQGDMFDSTMNYDFRKHCQLFFGEECIDAADFSGRITNMLMRYRLQTVTAQLNLLDSHDVSRFLSLCHGDVARYKLAILFQMTFVGMPMLFYGDELGIQGELEDEYRKPMPWEATDCSLHDFIKRAISLRKKFEPLCRGDFQTVFAKDGTQLLIYRRSTCNKAVTVALNAGTSKQIITNYYGSAVWAENWDGSILGSHGFVIFVDGTSKQAYS